MNKYLNKASVILVLLFITSCNKEDAIQEYNINEISSLSVSTEKGLRNQEITFELLGEDNYTEFAAFFVNGEAIVNNVFSSSVEGEFNVYAEYDLAGTVTQTEISSFEVFIPKRKVLFEDYTGTWCAYCTAMIDRVDEMREITSDISVVSIHVGSNDPFTFSEAQALIDYYEVIFVPTGYQDRQYFYGDAWPVEFVTDYAGLDSSMTISLNSILNGDELSVNVEVLSDELFEDKKLVVYLLEDGLVYNQSNGSNNDSNSQFYQLGNPIPNFIHNDVLRASLTDVFGSSIPATNAFITYSTTLNYTVPAEYNLEKLSLVVFVADQDNVVINSQFAKVNETKGFQ